MFIREVNEIEAIQKKIEEAEELAKLNLYIEEIQLIHNSYSNIKWLSIFDKEEFKNELNLIFQEFYGLNSDN